MTTDAARTTGRDSLIARVLADVVELHCDAILAAGIGTRTSDLKRRIVADQNRHVVERAVDVTLAVLAERLSGPPADPSDWRYRHVIDRDGVLWTRCGAYDGGMVTRAEDNQQWSAGINGLTGGSGPLVEFDSRLLRALLPAAPSRDATEESSE